MILILHYLKVQRGALVFLQLFPPKVHEPASEEPSNMTGERSLLITLFQGLEQNLVLQWNDPMRKEHLKEMS